MPQYQYKDFYATLQYPLRVILHLHIYDFLRYAGSPPDPQVVLHREAITSARLESWVAAQALVWHKQEIRKDIQSSDHGEGATTDPSGYGVKDKKELLGIIDKYLILLATYVQLFDELSDAMNIAQKDEMLLSDINLVEPFVGKLVVTDIEEILILLDCEHLEALEAIEEAAQKRLVLQYLADVQTQLENMRLFFSALRSGSLMSVRRHFSRRYEWQDRSSRIKGFMEIDKWMMERSPFFALKGMNIGVELSNNAGKVVDDRLSAFFRDYGQVEDDKFTLELGPTHGPYEPDDPYRPRFSDVEIVASEPSPFDRMITNLCLFKIDSTIEVQDLMSIFQDLDFSYGELQTLTAEEEEMHRTSWVFRRSPKSTVPRSGCALSMIWCPILVWDSFLEKVWTELWIALQSRTKAEPEVPHLILYKARTLATDILQALRFELERLKKDVEVVNLDEKSKRDMEGMIAAARSIERRLEAVLEVVDMISEIELPLRLTGDEKYD
ncbi:hypothetical protein Dda_0058 [Drechslerella dactyloides]|uniref:Uncharacterized protein n=1 Tax=Drechslerella dactyloides TaxID=74499 RepID=A0AAD6NLK7_DREDA|nr:hypothetical protein Dda_0058 [Drechslerella dactyloides]